MSTESLKIVQVFQTKNPSYILNRAIKPVGVFVHSTGAVNKTLKRWVDAVDVVGKNQYGNHWNQASATKSVHAWIGYDKDDQIIVAQTLPYDRACWGAGGGSKGSYNYNPHAYLQFEICQGSNTDAEYYWKAIKVAEEYCAHLCREFGWTAEQITSHKEAHAAGYASNHGDPQSWMVHFDDDMDKFRSRVAALLNGTKTPVETVKPQATEPPAQPETPAKTENSGVKTVKVELQQLKNGSRGTQVKTLQRLLNGMFYDCGTVDGIWGAKTNKAVLAFQKDKGLVADGIVGTKTWDALLK